VVRTGFPGECLHIGDSYVERPVRESSARRRLTSVCAFCLKPAIKIRQILLLLGQVLASFALSSAAWAATCSNASLSGTYGFLDDGTDSNGAPFTAVTQITFDSTTGTFSGETTASHDGVITTTPINGTYAVASNCTGTGTPTGGSPFSIVVTSTGFLAVHRFSEGFAVKQGSPTCTNAEVKGSFWV